LDNANNPLLDVADANTVPASQAATISYAGLQSLAVGNLHLVPLPPDFAMPLGAQINIADLAAIDSNDREHCGLHVEAMQCTAALFDGKPMTCLEHIESMLVQYVATAWDWSAGALAWRARTGAALQARLRRPETARLLFLRCN